MSKTDRIRFDVLDGLRGLAIVFVFLNHVDSAPIVSALPSFLQPLVAFFFSSGTIAVSFFFILSGFLMGYLYQHPQPMAFIRKRYARIFPPFVVMVLCMSLFHAYPTLSLFSRVGVMLLVALAARLVWVYGVEKIHAGPILIHLFLLFQAVVLVWYGFVIMRQPPLWFASLPAWLHMGTISAVNATLTLPLGDYIPMLDGVYWSLIGEVLFYLLYPYLFAPFVQKLKNTKKWITVFLLLSLIPFFFGLHVLLSGLRGFSMLYVEYFFYFCVGIAAAQAVLHHASPRANKWSVVLHPITLFLLLFAAHASLFGTDGWINTVVKLLWAVPFGLLVYYSLDHSTRLHHFLTSKVLIFFGAISYSLYITHTSIVDGMHLVFKPTSVVSDVFFISIAFGVAVGVAYLFHTIIEEPYFTFKELRTDEALPSYITQRIGVVLFIAFIGVSLISKYMSGFNFFTVSDVYSPDRVQSIPLSSSYSLNESPLYITFVANTNNMGIITLHITHTGVTIPQKQDINGKKKQLLWVGIRQQGSNAWYATQETSTVEIGTSTSFPFGFPPLVDSQGKTYELALKIENQSSIVILHTKPAVFTVVSKLDKKTLLTHPVQLIRLISSKLWSVIANQEARLVIVTVIPFLLLFTYLALKR